MKKRRKISYQKIFCAISFLFILGCILFYGIRFIMLYIENNTTDIESITNLSKRVTAEHANQSYFKNINSNYYFVGDTDKNYVKYKNITWRIVKITNNNSTVLISDEPLTSLAFGSNTYEESPITDWLNETNNEQSGILANAIGSDYLTNTNACIDTLDDTKNITCDDIYKDYQISLLSMFDYANAGSSDSYINNGYYTYLSNTNNDNEVWYIDDEGKLNTNDGTDIYSIKPVITLNSTVELIEGEGTKDNPYQIEKENDLFASYVKLDNDLWRIYNIEDNNLKLVLTDYLKTDNENYQTIYSNTTSFHNDEKVGTLAYYLNNTYFNRLNYSDQILNNYWSNGYYSSENNFDYTEALDKEVDTEIALLSIGDINLVPSLDEFFLSTGLNNFDNKIYVYNNDGTITDQRVTSKANVVPTISIDKNILTKGTGTIDDPYGME